jgi:hypothetical protein
VNKLDYGSLEACKRLRDAEIVVETDFYHVVWHNTHFPIESKEWVSSCGNVVGENDFIAYPALSMAEAWRILPWKTTISGCVCYRTLYQEREDMCIAAYYWQGVPLMTCRNINPTDALIDLKIWIEKGEEK